MSIATHDTEQPAISKELLQKSILEDSFYDFVGYFWDTVVPEDPVWNWHIEYLCREMQKVAERVFAGKSKKYDLIINVPPGSTKSTICSVMFPAWIWTRMPTCRSICGSYSYALSLQLSRKTRDIITSEKFIELFDAELRGDQNTKGHFENTAGGYRYSTSTGGTVTGYHGHFLIIDDPLNPQEASSEVELKNANVWIRETLSSRKVDKEITPTILIMQRLHEDDPTADMLGQKNVPTKHIKLPAEIDKASRKTVKPKSLIKRYKKDPDKPGMRLLDPVRLSRMALDESLSKLLEYGYAGQFLQSPVPLAGGMFKTSRLRIDQPPLPIGDWIQKIRFWDKAGTEGGGAFTVGVLLGEDKEHRFWILDVIRVQLDTGEREKLVLLTAQMDGLGVKIGIEQEPGSGGKESAQNTVKNLRGFNVEVVRPTGDKAIRAMPLSAQVNVGNVYMAVGEWNNAYMNELTLFPNSKYKDQVDASSGAFTLLTFSGKGRIGVF